MISLIDSLAVVTPGQLASVQRDRPIDALAWYLPSPSQQLTKWTPDNLLPVAAVVSGVLPVYVGQQKGIAGCPDTVTAFQGQLDAADARKVLAGYGMADSQGLPCCLDVEYSTWLASPTNALAYITAWSVSMLEWGFTPVIYSSRAGITGCAGQLPADVKYWVADWKYQSWQPISDERHALAARLADIRPDQLLWQYASQPYDPSFPEGVDWSMGNVPLWSPAPLAAGGELAGVAG